MMAAFDDGLAETELPDGTVRTDVLIVGSGPAGGERRPVLVGARDPQHHDHQVPVDREHARAHITNQRTMEIFRDLGIEGQVLADASPHEIIGDTVFCTSIAGRPAPARDPELYYQPSTVPGSRRPHVWVGDNTRKLSSLDVAPMTRFTLITGIAGDAWISAAGKVARDLGIPLEAVVIGPGREVTDIYFDGSGEAAGALIRELDRLGASKVMVIAARPESELAESITADVPVALRYHDVVMHVPVDVAERAREAAAQCGADALVSVGGGSTTGLAKAVALTSGLPVVAVPTTYAGSEATSVWGLTEGARKTTGADPRVLPRAIIYDAALTVSLPVPMSVASGFNALAHCVDSMWAPNADPIDRAFAGEGIRALRAGLPKIVADPAGLEGREQALYAAYLSAAAFASAGSGLHHKICHVLGGACNLPHAQTHAVVLPYVLAFNGPAMPEAQRRIAEALGAPRAIDGLEDLRWELQAPRALRDYGFAESDIPGAAEAIAAVVPPGNPRPVTLGGLRRLLHAAWEGADPAAMAGDEENSG